MEINEYEAKRLRYMFAKEFLKGKILNISSTSYMDYYGSKMLLNSKVKEIWNNHFLDNNNEYVIRKYDSNKELIIELIHKKELPVNSFDSIIIFDTLQFTKSPSKFILNLHKLLRNNGLLVLSVINKNISEFYENIENKFSKEELENILKDNFYDVKIYSQYLLSSKQKLNSQFDSISGSTDKIRTKLNDAFLKIDPDSNFYKKFLQKKIQTVDNITHKYKKTFLNENFQLLPFDKNHTPLFFIAVGRKKET